ncbi:hypothetical protein L7F22_042865 [Adiantum nelumboides]|nr:hypothetical protein [Adiantum nelumboides]
MDMQDQEFYEEIKRVAALHLASPVPSQVINTKKALNERGQAQYCANVSMKINIKLGGTNQIIEGERDLPKIGKNTMLIGADVTHGAPGTTMRAWLAQSRRWMAIAPAIRARSAARSTSAVLPRRSSSTPPACSKAISSRGLRPTTRVYRPMSSCSATESVKASTRMLSTQKLQASKPPQTRPLEPSASLLMFPSSPTSYVASATTFAFKLPTPTTLPMTGA